MEDNNVPYISERQVSTRTNRRQSTVLLLLIAIVLITVSGVILFTIHKRYSSQSVVLSVKHTEGKILPDVPEFPVYPGAAVIESSSSEDTSSTSHRAVWESPDDPEAVSKWYGDYFATHNEWTVVEMPDLTKSSTLYYRLQRSTKFVNLYIEREEPNDDGTAADESLPTEIVADFL